MPVETTSRIPSPTGQISAAAPGLPAVPTPTPTPIPDAQGVIVASPTPSASPAPEVSPTPTGTPTPKVVLQGLGGPAFREISLVMGSGDARALAGVGVLQVLSDERIPIGAIGGTGVGCLLAALYASQPKVPKLEWSIERFASVFWGESGTGWLGRIRSAIPRLATRDEMISAELRKAFKGALLETLSIKAQLLAEQKPNSVIEVIQQGPIADGVRKCLADGGTFPLVKVDGKQVGRSDQMRYAVSDLRGLNRGLVIVVDTRDDDEVKAASPVEQKEISLADWVIRPDLRGIRREDYSRRSEIYLRGREATKERIGDIRRVILEGALK